MNAYYRAGANLSFLHILTHLIVTTLMWQITLLTLGGGNWDKAKSLGGDNIIFLATLLCCRLAPQKPPHLLIQTALELSSYQMHLFLCRRVLFADYSSFWHLEQGYYYSWSSFQLYFPHTNVSLERGMGTI